MWLQWGKQVETRNEKNECKNLVEGYTNFPRQYDNDLTQIAGIMERIKLIWVPWIHCSLGCGIWLIENFDELMGCVDAAYLCNIILGLQSTMDDW